MEMRATWLVLFGVVLVAAILLISFLATVVTHHRAVAFHIRGGL
jgi:hypothetical protein